LLQGDGKLRNPQEGENIGQRVVETPVEREHFAANFLADLALIVLRENLKVALEQFDEGKERIPSPVSNRKCLQNEPVLLREELKFIQQA
jgi:hypothetical protein